MVCLAEYGVIIDGNCLATLRLDNFFSFLNGNILHIYLCIARSKKFPRKIIYQTANPPWIKQKNSNYHEMSIDYSMSNLKWIKYKLHRSFLLQAKERLLMNSIKALIWQVKNEEVFYSWCLLDFWVNFLMASNLGRHFEKGKLIE